MNFKTILSNVICLFAVVLLLFFSLSFFSLSWFSSLSTKIAYNLLYEPHKFISIGWLFLSFSFFFVLLMFFIFRGRYFTISTLQYKCSINLNILNSYVKKYFEHLLKDNEFQVESTFLKNRLEIIVSIFSKENNIENLNILMKKAEQDIFSMLNNFFNYKSNFQLVFKLI